MCIRKHQHAKTGSQEGAVPVRSHAKSPNQVRDCLDTVDREVSHVPRMDSSVQIWLEQKVSATPLFPGQICRDHATFRKFPKISQLIERSVLGDLSSGQVRTAADSEVSGSEPDGKAMELIPGCFPGAIFKATAATQHARLSGRR